VPERGRLSFAHGAPATAGSVAFTIHAVRGEEREQLYSGGGSGPGWTEGLVDLARFAGRELELELAATVDGVFDAAAGIPAWATVEIERPAERDRPNVLVISLDTLRADHLSTYGYQRTTSPAIDSWAEGAAVFEAAVVSAPWTLPSHVSMLTGRDADNHGINFNLGADREVLFLAEMLAGEGYVTAAITGGGYLHPQYGFAQGFSSYRASGVSIGNERELEVGVERALEFLDGQRDRTWFLFFHTYEIHNPYRPRQPLADQLGLAADTFVDSVVGKADETDGFLARRGLRLMTDGHEVASDDAELERLAVDLYDCGVAYTDHHVGRILTHLRELGLDDETIVVLTSDHGELFGEHGVYNHISLYNENVHVPLIVAAPGGLGAGSRIPAQVRSIDIVPTVLELAGVSAPPAIDGMSLVPFLTGERPADHSMDLAWSFASASNFGIAVREDGRLHYSVRNGAWHTTGQREELFQREAPDSAWTEADATTEPAARLGETTRRRVETHLQGLRLRIDARTSPVALTGRFTGPMVQENRVKLLEADAAGVASCAEGTACFDVPPGEIMTLIFEGAHGRALTVEVDSPCAGEGPRTLTTDDATAARGVALRCTADGWHEGGLAAAAEGDRGGLAVWTLGTGGGGDAAEVDEALRQQLEALGYVTGDDG
jgi:arylsulfatase A-like enzyme